MKLGLKMRKSAHYSIYISIKALKISSIYLTGYLEASYNPAVIENFGQTLETIILPRPRRTLP
jgi:hypothetical protein